MKYLSIFSFVFLSSIAQGQNNYLLNIHIEGEYQDKLYLSNNLGGYDSTNVVNGTATFRGIKDKPAQVGIILQGYSNVGWVFLENSTIDVYCRYIESDAVKHHMIKIDTIIGSKSQDDLYEFDKLYGKYKSSNSPTWEFDLIKYTSSFSKPVAEWALFRLADNLENKQIEALIKMIGKENLSAKTLKWLQKAQLQNDILLEKLNIEDYVLDAKEGEVLLEDIINKIDTPYKIIHFWGVWCSPCISQIPYLKEFENEFREEATIIGIAYDSRKDTWLKYLKKYSLKGFELRENDDTKKLSSDIKVSKAPFYLLLDNENFVLTKGDLMEIKKYLNSNKG